MCSSQNQSEKMGWIEFSEIFRYKQITRFQPDLDLVFINQRIKTLSLSRFCRSNQA